MITRIDMKGVATYDNNGICIDNCKAVNFIYGPNGSGKSTISNYLQTPDDSKYANCSIDWDHGILSELVVYNRAFRENNFKGEIAGVFTLGQATIDDIKKHEELKKKRDFRQNELNSRNETLKTKKQEKQKNANDFRDTVWQLILKNHESEFKEAFTGVRADKEKFKSKVLVEYMNNHDSAESYESLVSKAKTLFASKPEKAPKFIWNIENNITKLFNVETDSIWGRIIVGCKDLPISKLIDQLNNSDWVSKGRDYIIGNNSRCPFCQQDTITQDLRNQLEQFFSGEYEEKINQINELLVSYQESANTIVAYLQQIANSLSNNNIGNIDVMAFTTTIDSLSSLFSKNIDSMSSKAKEPSVIVSLIDSSKIVNQLKSTIITANTSIDKHNRMVDNFSSERAQLIDDIWAYLLDINQPVIDAFIHDQSCFDKAIKAIEAQINSFKTEINGLDAQIIEAGKNITSVQPTVDEINRSLKSYGFNNFSIVCSPINNNLYQIQRSDGSLASNTLSEGEETFISFLYYLQLAKGATDITKVSAKKILVIDDPICSLDSTILYIVSAMVKDLIQQVKKGDSDVEQLFILTHNVFFHKEASFIDGRTQSDNRINYWVLQKDLNISTVRPFGTTNPIKTSYELLWQEINDSSPKSFVSIQNTMRRIIEYYFGMLGNRKYDYVIKKFDSIEEQQICKSLFYWINDGSHTIPDDLYFDGNPDSIDKYKMIFKRVFEVTGNESHYNMMMGIQDNTEAV